MLFTLLYACLRLFLDVIELRVGGRGVEAEVLLRIGREVHLFVHHDRRGDQARQTDSWLDAAYFAEAAADHRAGDIQPRDWQLRRIYSACPCCWPSSTASFAC